MHTRWQDARTHTAELFNPSRPDNRWARRLAFAITGLILLNVIAVILESVADIQRRFENAFDLFEQISLLLFTLEYGLRIWSVVDDPHRQAYRPPLRGRLRYMCSPLALIDLLTVLPMWLGLFWSVDLRVLRMARLLRVLKLIRYFPATNLMFSVLRNEARVIGSAGFTLFLFLTIGASLAYLLERDAQPEAFSSIPQAMWWAIVTVTTVGYGDVVPITPFGKIIGALLGLIGVAMVALPAGILASGFSDALNQRRARIRREVKEARSDGIIDTQEWEALQRYAKTLNVPESTLIDIIDDVRPASEPSPAVQCPHCGASMRKAA